jgi:hypothetical protein
VLVAAGAILAAGSVAAAETDGPAATSTELTVRPGEALTDRTPVSLQAAVRPRSATGYVRFTAAGRTLASSQVRDGAASAPSVYLPHGVVEVTAQFSPADPARFAPSTSAATRLRVTTMPNVWLTTSAGAVVAGSAPVTAGRAYVANVSGFLPESLVVLRIASRPLVPGIRVDATGRGSLALALPATFSPGVYTLTADSGSASTEVAFYVAPAGAPAAAPAAPVAVPVDAPVVVPAGSSPGSEPALASTGADTASLAGPGLLLLVVGMLLARTGRTREVGRRESRV